jgi:hypothetical protein
MKLPSIVTPSNDDRGGTFVLLQVGVAARAGTRAGLISVSL